MIQGFLPNDEHSHDGEIVIEVCSNVEDYVAINKKKSTKFVSASSPLSTITKSLYKD